MRTEIPAYVRKNLIRLSAQRFYLDFDPRLEMDTAHETPHDVTPIPGDVGADDAQGVSRHGRKKSRLPNRTSGNKRVFIRVLPSEHAAMAERAAEAGLTVSEFIRRIALRYKIFAWYGCRIKLRIFP